MTHPPRFDPGLQPERTALAWRRTALSLMVGALLSLRLLPPVLGHWSFAVGFGGIALAVLLWRRAGRRSAQTGIALHADRHLPDGSLPCLLAATVSAAGLLAAVYALR